MLDRNVKYKFPLNRTLAKKHRNLANMINEIINNNVLHVYVYLRLELVVNLPGHRFKRSLHNVQH